jgi:hypothetical protein
VQHTVARSEPVTRLLHTYPVSRRIAEQDGAKRIPVLNSVFSNFTLSTPDARGWARPAGALELTFAFFVASAFLFSIMTFRHAISMLLAAAPLFQLESPEFVVDSADLASGRIAGGRLNVDYKDGGAIVDFALNLYRKHIAPRLSAAMAPVAAAADARSETGGTAVVVPLDDCGLRAIPVPLPTEKQAAKYLLDYLRPEAIFENLGGMSVLNLAVDVGQAMEALHEALSERGFGVVLTGSIRVKNPSGGPIKLPSATVHLNVSA